jgi:hypothetical protein
MKLCWRGQVWQERERLLLAQMEQMLVALLR